MDKYKKRILIDLDGVLNTYNGNYDKDLIPSIQDGAEEFLQELNKTYEIYLFTSRNLLLSAKWLINNGIDGYFKDITSVKLPSCLYIDDRAINFKGDYKTTLNQIKRFRTYWN